MARNRKRRALYEVIGQTRSKSGYDEALEQTYPQKLDDEPDTTKTSERPTRWPKKPRIVQFNAGRLEVSMPYQLAVALLLGVVLLVLVVFRLGQTTFYLSGQDATDSVAKIPQDVQKVAPTVVAGVRRMPEPVEKTVLAPVSDEKVGPAKPKGNNRIVIQTYTLRAHLEPVRQYFADKGIETEIRKIGHSYYLVTTEKYENPERQGTDGYLAKQKIIELGAEYKAPPGYETFGSRPFHDAYGMRFDN